MAPFNSAVGDADFRSLRLANPVLSETALEGFIEYERTFIEAVNPGASAEAQARGHALAFARCGLDHKQLNQLAAACADFCARRSVVKRLAARREELARDPSPQAVEAVAKIDAERGRLEDLSALEKRYGQEELARLMAREDLLLALHQQMAQR